MKHETLAGDSIGNTIMAMLKKAQKGKCPVYATFNSVDLCVRPGDSLNSVAAFYWKKRREITDAADPVGAAGRKALKAMDWKRPWRAFGGQVFDATNSEVVDCDVRGEQQTAHHRAQLIAAAVNAFSP